MVGTSQHELPVEITTKVVVFVMEIGKGFVAEFLAQALKTVKKYARKIALLTTHVFANLAGQKLNKMKIRRGF